MKQFAHLFLIAALGATTLAAQNAAAPMSPSHMPDTVTVVGTGKVTTKPDRVMFTAGVETTAPTVDEAVRLNNERVAALIAALKKGGATENDLRTTNFNVFPQQVYEQNQKPRIVGFQANNSVTVTRQSPADAGKLLMTALNAGANQVSGLTFSVSDPVAARNKGLALALEDAKAKAALLATAAGRTIGRAMMITEGSGAQPPQPIYGRVMAMQAKDADVPVESGADELSFSVSVTYELR
jgi:uncharacterized protein YggE